jgi:multiple sugar transport system substrate-binding protein
MKKAVVVTIAVMLGFLPVILAGRNLGKFAQPHSPDAVHITFSAPASPQHRAGYEQVLRIFMRRNPHIFVEFKPGLHASYESYIQTQMLADRAPDLFWWQNEMFPEFAADGVLLDLMPYAKSDPEWNFDDYFELGFRECIIDGHLYAVPLQWGASIMFYNADLFERAGIDYDDEAWTWDAFIDAAEKMTADWNGDGRIDTFGVEMVPRMEWTFPFVWMAGGRVFDEEKTRCVINSPEGINAYHFLTDIFNHRQVQHIDYAGAVGEHVASLSDQFVEGNVGMKFSGPYYCSTLKQAPQYRWRIAYFPKNATTGIRATRFYQDLICVSRRTRHPEEAWKVVKFLLSPVTQRMVCRFGSIPIRKEIAYTTYNRDDTPWDELRLVNAIKHARLQPISTFYFEMDRRGQRYFEQMMAVNPGDRVSVETALERYEADVNEMFERARKRRGLAQSRQDAENLSAGS